MKNRSLSTVAGLSGSIALMLSGQVAHAQSENVVVESVTVQGNVVSVNLGSSAEGSAISSFLLDSPHRIAIDIMDASSPRIGKHILSWLETMFLMSSLHSSMIRMER